MAQATNEAMPAAPADSDALPAQGRRHAAGGKQIPRWQRSASRRDKSGAGCNETGHAAVTTIGKKVAYVKRAGQTRNHECHWPGCTEQVPPAKWGCPRHWFRLPRRLRTRIWETFRPGQEVNRTPSREYVQVAREVQAWIAEHGGRHDRSGN